MSDPGKNGPILVVDDDRDIRETLIEVMGGEGHAVVGVANGQEALEYLESAPELPRFILLDVMMPVMNGIQFRAKQKRHLAWSEIPVVVMTAVSREEMVVKLNDSQLDGPHLDGMRYLRKPIDLASLLALIPQA